MGHVASMEDKIIAYRVLVRKPGGKSLSDNLGIDGKIILKFIIQK